MICHRAVVEQVRARALHHDFAVGDDWRFFNRPRDPLGADAVREFERQRIDAALQAAQGNVTEAASRLGLERSHLYKKCTQLGIDPKSK